MRRCLHAFLGRIDYAEATDLQVECARRLREGGEERLLLLEHQAVITLGRNARPEDVLLDEAALRARGVSVSPTDRGGQVTYHGPGQLVGYPIIDLGRKPDVVGYVRRLEEIVIGACADAGVDGLGRNPVNSGVWAGDRKVCAIGVRVMRARVTLHGFALNCTTDLSWYDAIVPCGLTDNSVTSLSLLAGRRVTAENMASLVARRFADTFDRTLTSTGILPEPIPAS